MIHQQPPRKGAIRPKLRYAHQGGQNPPIIVIHGNATEAIGDAYKRYLEKHFQPRETAYLKIPRGRARDVAAAACPRQATEEAAS